MVADYSSITETPELKATREQIERLYHRYRFALDYVNGEDVLEVACGSGIGLGYLARKASKIAGGDIDEKNLAAARLIYNKKPYQDASKLNIRILHMDAHDLKFPGQCFGLVILYEAIYYLREPKRFVSEAKRVLKDNGSLIICTVNKDWADFHPSPYSHKYFSVPELYDLIIRNFREVKLYGGFPVNKEGAKNEIISLVKRIAVRFHLMPGSLTARAYLKRIFMGKLVPLPYEITEGMADYEPATEIPSDRECKEFKILYAIGRK